METTVQHAAAPVVQVRGLHLAQGAEDQQRVEELVALPQEVTAPGQPALGQQQSEEEGAGQEEAHLPGVEEGGRVLLTRWQATPQAPEHRAGVPGVGQGRRQHLAQLAYGGWRAVTAVLSKAAAEAGEAAKQSRHWHERAK